MEEKPGYWAVIPAAVRYDEQLPPNAKLLYAEISSLTDTTGFCFATNSYFQQLYGLSERTVQNLLKALQEHGYIRIEDGSGGSHRRRIFAGVNPLGETPAENCGGPPQKIAGGGAKNCTHNKKENKKKTNPPASPPRGRRAKAACEYEPELFERFWNLYPRRDGKAEARYEWDDLHPDRELMREMSAALRAQMESEEWLRGIGIPWACRWLRNRRWENEGLQLPQKPQRKEDGDVWL